MNLFRRRVDMVNGSILPNLLMFCIPLMISSVLQLLFNAADIVVVGRFAGSDSLAAVSSCTSLVNLFTNFFIGLSVGTNVVCARDLGSGDNEEVRKAAHTSMVIAILGGLMLAVIGFFFSRYLLGLMGSPADVIDKSTLYLKIYFMGMPAMMIYNFGSAILRSIGDTKRPLYYLSLAGVINVILNLILVIVFRMDVAGVGIATIISQYVSGILIAVCLAHENSAIRVEFNHLFVDFNKLKDMFRIGLPAGIQGTVFSLSNVVIQSSVNSFGKVVMAGNGAAANIEGFVYMAMNSFYQGCMTFTGQNVGAGKVDRVPKVLITAVLCACVVGGLSGYLCWLFGDTLVGVYAQEAAVIAAGCVRLGLVCKPYFLCGIMDTLVGSLRGMGSSVTPMIVSLMGACVFRLIWIATIFQTHHTIETLYISYPISWALTASIHMVCWIFRYRKVCRENALKA
ncbi:MAG: MATE family efflux transporter [Erysipelotrichaceae bacterium]|nr:MATE family efflux transporter [Erysipelotrichaceae bacterium]